TRSLTLAQTRPRLLPPATALLGGLRRGIEEEALSLSRERETSSIPLWIRNASAVLNKRRIGPSLFTSPGGCRGAQPDAGRSRFAQRPVANSGGSRARAGASAAAATRQPASYRHGPATAGACPRAASTTGKPSKARPADGGVLSFG